MRWAVWISAAAAAGLIVFLYYFTIGETPPARAPGAALEPDASVPYGRSATAEPAPQEGWGAASVGTASELKLAVSGVMIAPASRGAVISIGGQPARLFAEGEKIADGVVLRTVNPDRVVVDRGGELLRFRVLAASEGSGPAVLRDADAAPDEQPVPIPPLGTEERRARQSQNRD